MDGACLVGSGRAVWRGRPASEGVQAMSRRRVSWVVAFAILAVSAIVVSAAMGKWRGETNPTYVTGTQITHNGESFITIATQKETVYCESVSFVTEFAKETEKLTLTPTYNECKTVAGKFATILPNGCKWTVYGGKENKTHFTGGSLGLDCPPSTTLEIRLYTSKAEDEKGTAPVCTFTLPSQDPGPTFGGEVTFTNTPEAATPDVDITTVSAEAVYFRDGPAGTCGSAVQTQALFTGGITARGYSDASHTKQVKLEVF